MFNNTNVYISIKILIRLIKIYVLEKNGNGFFFFFFIEPDIGRKHNFFEVKLTRPLEMSFLNS